MLVDYNSMIPKNILFNLKELEALKILKISMAKKLIQNGEISITKIGSKIHINRIELIRFLEESTIERHSHASSTRNMKV
jgi:translation elongation factor EF-Ts